MLFCLCEELPNHESGIKQTVEERLIYLGAPDADIKVLILDNFDYKNQLHIRKVRSIRKVYPTARLLLLCKMDISNPSVLERMPDALSEFTVLFLWTLTRSQIRTIAEQYTNATRTAIETNILVDRAAENLEKLNLYRTPLNCITLFRIAESEVDISPKPYGNDGAIPVSVIYGFFRAAAVSNKAGFEG